MTITVIQVNWNGKGDDRSFKYFAKDADELGAKLDRIERAYNMDSTLIKISA